VDTILIYACGSKTVYNYDVYNLQNTQLNFSVPTILKTTHYSLFYSTWPFAKLITITQIGISKTFSLHFPPFKYLFENTHGRK